MVQLSEDWGKLVLSCPQGEEDGGGGVPEGVDPPYGSSYAMIGQNSVKIRSRAMGLLIRIIDPNRINLMRVRWWVPILLLVLLPAVRASTRLEIHPAVDTYVDNNSPDSSFSHEVELVVANTADNSIWAYLMFDLSGIPANAQIISATLFLSHAWGDLAVPRVYRVLQPIASDVTWETRPQYSPEWYADGSGEYAVHWDVSTVISSSLADRYVSFCLVFEQAAQRGFYSHESAYSEDWPALVVEYNTSPQIGTPEYTDKATWADIFTFRLSASDPDGDAVKAYLVLDGSTYQMTQTSQSEFLYCWSPKKEDVGNHTFFFRVTDGTSTTESETFSLTVEKVPTSLSLMVSPTTVHLDEAVYLIGKLNPAIAGTLVRVRLFSPDNSALEKTAYTQEDGSLSLKIENFNVRSLGMWRGYAAWDGDPYYEGSVSPEVVFEVIKAKSNLTVLVSENVLRANKPTTIWGRLDPPLEGEEITLRFWLGGLTFQETVTTGPGGEFTYRFKPQELCRKHGVPDFTGSWSLTVAWGGNQVYFSCAETAGVQVLAPLWVETQFLLAIPVGAGGLAGLVVAVTRARATYKPPPARKEELVFEVVGG